MRLVLLLALARAAFAQTGTESSILGVVTDPTGAVVANAEVRLSNLDTGISRSVRSSEHGAFEFQALQRGAYSVSVSSPRFVSWQVRRIDLSAGEQRRLTPALRIGDVQQQVTVEAGVELMQTEKSSIEASIEEKQIRELPLNGRNALELVNLVPGMRYRGAAGIAVEHTVQGNGIRDDQTGFNVDGVDSNDPSNEKGVAMPSLESIAQFQVQTSNFSAELGRNPMQVQIVTKSGSNQFHGTLWEFHRNFALDARNAFATTTPKLIRNQFGASLGGPALRNRTFFFANFEGLRVRSEALYNVNTVAPEMLQGDFSSLGTRTITDPTNSQPFANRQIPAARISPASRYFFPFLLQPNAPDLRFRAVAPRPGTDNNSTLRIDHQINADQRFHVRWVRYQATDANRGYRPDLQRNQDLVQHSFAANYNWNIRPSLLFTLAAGYLQSDTVILSPDVGTTNHTAMAGVRGFQTEGREDAIGIPTVNITGYAGFNMPAQVPARFRREDLHGKASFNYIRSAHTLGFGFEYNDRRTLAWHSSNSARGTFTFNNQYTTNGFADYLLGLLASDERNYPLKSFGMGHSPYSALYVQDYWRVSSSLTLNLGLRFDRWHEKRLVRNNGATFDVKRGLILAATDDQGRVDLTAQPVSRFLGPATAGLWKPASEFGVPPGLFQARGYLSPRVGAAWRPFGGDGLVVRAGYGIFTGNYNGNITGSQVIGPPYWTFERQTFTRASLQRWETAFPAESNAFIAPSVTAAAHDVLPMKIHEFNVSIQKAIAPIDSAITVSYVGNRGRDLISRFDYNEVTPGSYTNLQAARPYPLLGTVRLYENIGKSWYNALQLKFERRFSKGLSYGLSYAFARNIDENGASLTDFPLPFAPKGYNRGRSELERRHVLTTNAVWAIPFGKGLLGGWQLSGLYSFTSGTPLTFMVPGATLGNGFNTRPNLAGNPRVASPNADQWFDASAFGSPARFAFGNSGLGLMDGPGQHNLDAGLMKNFYFHEAKYVQFRWELFNLPNHVNLADPNTQLGVATTGRILSSGAARQMQFALKVVF